MPTYEKISADEARTKAASRVQKTGHGDIVAKAATSSPKWDPETRTARFVMSTQQADRYGDVVVTAGIDTTKFEANPVGLLFHASRSWPVAKWTNLEKVLRARPARIEGDFAVLPEGGPVKEVDQVAWMLEHDGIRACSIGFAPNWDSVETIRGDDGEWLGFKFLESELLECSICSIPANPGALAKSVDNNIGLARELIEEVLDNWARSPLGGIMPRAEFEEKFKSIGRIGESTFIQLGNAAPQWVSASVLNGETTIKQKPAAVDDFRAMFGLPPLGTSEAQTPPATVDGEKSAPSEKKIAKNVVKRLGALLGLGKSEPEPEKSEDPPAIQTPPLTAEEKAAIQARALETATRVRSVV